MFSKDKVIEWLRRYFPAEVLSLLATVLSSTITFKLTGSALTTALVGTWAGNIAFFGYILLSDIIRSVNACKSKYESYRLLNFLHNIRAMVLEFGVAELFDSLLIRPLLMYYLPIWVGDLSWGVVIAKLLADVTFYIPTIIAYELRLKYFKEKV